MIGIYGDSFTDVNPSELVDARLLRLPWPLWLARLQKERIVNYGRAATSTWFSYQKFITSYKDYSTIVFGYSNYNRWPTINYLHYGTGEPDFVGGLSHIFHAEQISYVPTNMKKLAWRLIEAYPHLEDEKLSLFIYQTIFDSVNTLCREAGIRLVNLMPFEQSNIVPEIQISLDKSAGPCLTNLVSVSGYEFVNDDRTWKFPQVGQLNAVADRRFCHINPHNNKVMATIIAEALQNNLVDCKDIVNDPRWSYDPQHLQYLIDEL